MSESAPPKNRNEDEVPPWMQAVSEETLYNADPPHPSKERASQENRADPQQTSSSTASGQEEATVLRRRLSIAMGDPSEIPQPDPNLQPTPVGHVRADLKRRLEQATSALETRYATGFSSSLLIEYSLRRTLLDLRERAEDSALVQWLDSILPRQ